MSLCSVWQSDNYYGISNESDTEEGKGHTECGDAEEVQYVTSTSEHSENVLSGGNAAITLNGSVSKSTQDVAVVTGNHPPRCFFYVSLQIYIHFSFSYPCVFSCSLFYLYLSRYYVYHA